MSEFRQWIQRRTFLHPDFNRFNMWKECTNYWKRCEQTSLKSSSSGSYFVIHDWWQPFLYQEINIFQDRNKVVNIKKNCAILKRNFAQSKDPEKKKNSSRVKIWSNRNHGIHGIGKNRQRLIFTKTKLFFANRIKRDNSSIRFFLFSLNISFIFLSNF